jgi:hypothetical protein
VRRIIGSFPLILAATVATAFAQSGNGIVDEFFPQTYVNNAATLGEQIKHVTCYAVYQTAPRARLKRSSPATATERTARSGLSHSKARAIIRLPLSRPDWIWAATTATGN